MLTQTIPAYLYQQYNDDDDVRAFVDAFNEASQQQLDDFNALNLPYYPGLTGDLLNWVAEGLYGLTRTALETPPTAALGPLNTQPLNTAALNSYVAPTQTYYSLTDDVFQRILTWDFFKGDGKRFCMRWLKRRIMRFLVGANGVDPEPWNPGFVIGPEDTSAISVQVASSVLTVTINQALISSQVQLVPNILTLFQLAFEGGQLELPAQYTSYVVNIETTLTVTVSPLSESAVGSGATLTTGTATVTVAGGSGDYTYAWTFSSGGTGISINSSSAAATSFTAAGLTSGEGVSGTALCTVTDTITSNTATASVSVSLERGTAPMAAASPSSLTATGATATVSTAGTSVMVTGGTAPYTYLWTWSSGGAGITINSASSAATTFTGTGLSAGGSETGTALCTITDHFGQTTTCTVSVSVSRTNLVIASLSAPSLSVTGAAASESTGSTTVTASGGQPGYTYSWAWQSGGSGIAINSPTAATTNFTGSALASGSTKSGVAICTVKDTLGQTTAVTCDVSIVRVTAVSTSASPATQFASGIGTTQTTGISTVTASGGSGSYSYAWTWSSGGTNLTINSPSSAATTFKGSGMVAGDTYSGVARCVVTDGYGQTSATTVSVSIVCSVTIDTYTNQAALVVTIPNDTSQVVIEGWGGGATGGSAFGAPCAGKGGGGGGAGGYFRKTIALTSANWGKTLNVSATGAGVTLTVASGTFALSTLTAHVGTVGVNGSTLGPGAGGAGGTATGGDVNTTGGAGGHGALSTGGGGGAPVTGVHGGPYGQGGLGASVGGFSGNPGQAAGAVFDFS